MSLIRPSLVGLLMLACAASSFCADGKPDRDQPKSHVVSGYGGVPLVVQEWGNPEGYPIVFLHGFSFGAISFKHQIGEIAEKYRLVAPDLRGHGLSAKPWQEDAYNDTRIWAEDLDAVFEALNVREPILIGWSFGGYVAMSYLRHCRANCAAGLVLTGSLAGLVPRPPPPDPKDFGMPPARGDARADNYHDLFEAADWMTRVMTFAPPSTLKEIQDTRTIVMMPPLVRRAMAGLPLENADLLPKLKLPILFIYGASDGTVPEDSVNKAVRQLADARAVSYENVGHSAFAERPSRFNSDVMEFVAATLEAQ